VLFLVGEGEADVKPVGLEGEEGLGRRGLFPGSLYLINIVIETEWQGGIAERIGKDRKDGR
jgi:hypothetical protein